MELLLLAAAALALAGLVKKKPTIPAGGEQALPPQPSQDGGGADRTSAAPNFQQIMGDIAAAAGAAVAAAPLVSSGISALTGGAAAAGGTAAATAGTSSSAAAGTAATATAGSTAAGTTTATSTAAGTSAGAAVASDVAVVGLSLAEGIAGLVYLAFVVAEMIALFIAGRRQRWTDWYGTGRVDGIQNRYRSMLINFETQHNDEVAKRCPQTWWPNGTRRYDEDAKTYVLIPPTLPTLQSISSVRAGMLAARDPSRFGAGSTPAPAPVRPEWLEICAVHRLYAVERLARWNSVLFDFYRSRQWTVEEIEKQTIAMTDENFNAFIADELAAQRNADFLGYKLPEVSRVQLQSYSARYVSIEKGVKWSQLQGEAYAITRAAVDGFGFGWPGDFKFVEEIKWRCNLTWSHVGERTLMHRELPVAIDVVSSREQESPVLVDMRSPQQRAETAI